VEPLQNPPAERAGWRRGTWLVIGMITFALLLVALAMRYRQVSPPRPPATSPAGGQLLD
jgi:hypothetical protein